MFLPFFGIIFAIIFILPSNAIPPDSFKAAVFEHARRGNLNDTTAENIVSINLDYYKRAAGVAASKGAKLILFPEYGIFPASSEREKLKGYLEHTPDPETIRTNPCNERKVYEKRPILYALSCMAKSNDLVVVANTGDIQPCDGKPDCPEDGVYQLNTNVVFDRDGTLLLRYHKEYLFFELGMDLPKENHNPIFKTDFGTFATFICFDIIFKRAAEVARLPNIDAILFSTLWMNSFDFMTSVQLSQSWAIGNNATILTSNLQIPGYGAIGSGIFNGQVGAVAYMFNPDGESKLIVGEVHKKSSQNRSWKTLASSVTLILENGTVQWREDFRRELPKNCSFAKVGHTKNIYKEYRCWKENFENYTLTKLTPKGHVEACNNGLCCYADYVTSRLQENYYLGVFNGTHNSFNRYFWAEENCFVARCDALDGDRCTSTSSEPLTRFYRLRMVANFTTDFVYPSILTNGSTLLPVAEWEHGNISHKKYIDFDINSGTELLVAGFKGRSYDRDPPHQR